MHSNWEPVSYKFYRFCVPYDICLFDLRMSGSTYVCDFRTLNLWRGWMQFGWGFRCFCFWLRTYQVIWRLGSIRRSRFLSCPISWQEFSTNPLPPYSRCWGWRIGWCSLVRVPCTPRTCVSCILRFQWFSWPVPNWLSSVGQWFVLWGLVLGNLGKLRVKYPLYFI